MYILQQVLFSFEDLMELELKERLPLFFSALDLRPIIKKLRSNSPQGAKGFPKDAILRALLAAPLVGLSTFTGLVERLESDIKFRYQCGFGVGRVPSVATFSRVFQKITETKAMDELFTVLVNECRERGIINGEIIALSPFLGTLYLGYLIVLRISNCEAFFIYHFSKKANSAKCSCKYCAVSQGELNQG